MRRGFSLVMAIIILVIVAVMSAMILGFSSQTIKTTSNIYLREQGKLLALSATEYALLALSGHNHNTNCIETINIDAEGAGLCYEVNMSLSYIVDTSLADAWSSSVPVGCPSWRVLSNNLNYTESNLTVVIDTIVSCNQEGEHIRFHRRSIQKP